jgi:hypothetical protein
MMSLNAWLSLALLSAAPTASTSEPPKTQPKRLTTHELKELFVGFSMTNGAPKPPYPRMDIRERFRIGGRYALFDHGSQDEGSYEIRDDEVCTRLPEISERCRYLVIDNEARYWIRDVRPSSEFHWVKFEK